MEQVTEDTRAVLQYLALEPERQLLIAEVQVPQRNSTPAAELSHSSNGLLDLVRSCHELFSQFSRSAAGERMVVGSTTLEELQQLFILIQWHPTGEHWNQEALRNSPAWMVVRRIARIALNELSWVTETPSANILRKLPERYAD